jgi:hypothetical protein
MGLFSKPTNTHDMMARLQSVFDYAEKVPWLKEHGCTFFEAGSVVGINNYSHLIPGLLAPTQ